MTSSYRLLRAVKAFHSRGLYAKTSRSAHTGSASFRLTAIGTLLFVLLSLVLWPAPARAQSSFAATDISGSWTGVLGAGQNQLHLILTVNKTNTGEYSGQVNSVDQGTILPLDSVTVENKKLRFEVKSIGGVYEGTLDDKGSQINGTWTQATTPGQPLSFERQKAGASSASTAKAPSGPPQKPLVISLDVLVPIAPTAFNADGKMHLVYELHIVNMGRQDCTLTQVETVSADGPAKSLGSFSGTTLDGMIDRPGQTAAEKSKLAGGTEAVVYMWVTVSPQDLPKAIRHRLVVKVGNYPDALTLETVPVSVRTGPIVISAPLQGNHWLAANGPSNTSGHRRALIPVGGRAVISQRFAIDWVKVGEDGKTYKGDPLDNKNYYAFGSNALAVADGIVTEVKDGIPLNVPGINSRAVPITLETVGGNHVILNIGNGNYAFYAHLQPGSIRVKLGDKVHRGQILGLVGNTGNSTEPHLHFHISNASSPLGSEGLPYSLRSFQVEGKATGLTWNPATEKGAPETHWMEIPLENDVVRFAPN